MFYSTAIDRSRCPILSLDGVDIVCWGRRKPKMQNWEMRHLSFHLTPFIETLLVSVNDTGHPHHEIYICASLVFSWVGSTKRYECTKFPALTPKHLVGTWTKLRRNGNIGQWTILRPLRLRI